MKKLLVVFVFLSVLAVSCKHDEVVVEPVSFKGTVLDATMDSVALLTESGDTVGLKMFEEDELPGVFINDIVNIVCKDSVMAAGDTLRAAAKIDFIKMDYAHLIDTWQQEKEGKTCGFTLNDDYTASSINTGEFDVRKWEVDRNGYLVLTVRTGGSRVKIAYIMEKFDADSLILVNTDSKMRDWVLSNK